MLEKRYLHRNDWSRITSRRYSQKWVEEQDFTGYIALTEIHEITTPFVKPMAGKNICIIDKNYTRLQQLPMHVNYMITTTFNDKGQVVQWYIDITNCTGVDQGEPYMEDLFLDVNKMNCYYYAEVDVIKNIVPNDPKYSSSMPEDWVFMEVNIDGVSGYENYKQNYVYSY